MKVRPGVADAPKFTCDEFRVASEEARRADRLILIEGFSIGVIRAGRDVMELQIGVRRDPNYALPIGLEARSRKLVACEIDA